MTVAENQQQLLDTYAFIENPQERLGAIVDAVRHLPRLPEDQRTEAHLVKGCTSRVWLVAEQTAEGRWRFHSDCDSPLVRALVHLLCQSFEGVTAAEAATAEVTVLDQLDLTRNLSPTRLDGLKAVREQIAATVTTSQKP